MKFYITKLKSIGQYVKISLAVFFIALMVLHSDVIKTAVSTAVGNCLNSVIPSIFPLLTVSFFILETGFPVKIKHIADNTLRKYFGLSGNCAEAVILGLTSGYLSATKTAAALKDDTQISDEQAKRLALFFTNPGISFTIILTGISATGSFIFGLRTYIISVTVNILFAYIYNVFNKYLISTPISANYKKGSVAFIDSVTKSSSSIISISFYIILFSCISGLITSLFSSEILKNAIIMSGEITSAITYSAERYPLYILAGLLPFGGICIFIQTLPELIKLKINPVQFLIIRLMHGFFCMMTEYTISLLFPIAEYTAIFYKQVKFSNSSPSGSVALIFLCAIYLCSVKRFKQSSTDTTNKVM